LFKDALDSARALCTGRDDLIEKPPQPLGRFQCYRRQRLEGVVVVTSNLHEALRQAIEADRSILVLCESAIEEGASDAAVAVLKGMNKLEPGVRYTRTE